MGAFDDLAPSDGAFDDIVAQYKATLKQSPSMTDYLRSAAAGVNNIITTTGEGARLLGADQVGTAIRDFGQSGEKYWTDAMTPAGKQAASAEHFGDRPLSTIGMSAAQSLPGMAAMAIPGYAGAKAIQAVGVVPKVAGALEAVGVGAGRAGRVAEAVPGALGFGGAEGLYSGASNAAQTAQEVEAIPLEKLSQLPQFQTFYNRTDPNLTYPERVKLAKQALSMAAEKDVALKTAISTGAIGAATGGGLMGQLVKPSRGVVRGALEGAGKEALQEGLQSGPEQLIQNLAAREYYEPTREIAKDVLKSAIIGAGAGGLLGGIGGGVHGAMAKPAPAADAAAPEPDASAREREALAALVKGEAVSAADTATLAQAGLAKATEDGAQVLPAGRRRLRELEAEFAAREAEQAKQKETETQAAYDQRAEKIAALETGSAKLKAEERERIDAAHKARNEEIGQLSRAVAKEQNRKAIAGKVVKAQGDVGAVGFALKQAAGIDTAAPDVTVFGKPVAEMTDQELTTAAQGHRMSAFREAAKAEVVRRGNSNDTGSSAVSKKLEVPDSQRKDAERSGVGIGDRGARANASGEAASRESPGASADAGTARAITHYLDDRNVIRKLEPGTQAPAGTKAVVGIEAARTERKRRLIEARRPNPAKDSLNEWIAKRGGVDITERLDITGDEKNHAYNATQWLFRNTGEKVDELARRAHEGGYLTDVEIGDVDGGVQALKDKIRAEVGGQRHYAAGNESQMEADRAQREEQDIIAAAEAYGIPTEALTLDQVKAAVIARQANEGTLVDLESLEQARLEREAIQAENLTPEDPYADYYREAERGAGPGEEALRPGDEAPGKQPVAEDQAEVAEAAPGTAQGNRDPGVARGAEESEAPVDGQGTPVPAASEAARAEPGPVVGERIGDVPQRGVGDDQRRTGDGGGIQKDTPGDTQPASQVAEDRRRPEAAALRKKVAEMSRDELHQALLTDHLTGLGNRRAYEEAQKLPVQVSIDVDSLKWINDALGHTSGDEMLRAVGRALAAETAQAYHPSGDEFVVQAETPEAAEAIMSKARAALDQAMIEATLPDGAVITKQGIGISYGKGATIEEAESGLRADKAARETSGARPGRGAEPAGVARKAAEGDKAESQNAEVTRTQEQARFFASIKAQKERRDAVAEKLTTILDRDGGVKGVFESGHVYLLTRSSSGKNPYRVTTFLPDGTPSGHREYGSINGDDNYLDNAVSEFMDKDIEIVDPSERPALKLTQQTPVEVAAQAAQSAAQAAQAAAESVKQAVDAMREGFALTGSNRAADQAAARGQLELAPAKPQNETPAPVSPDNETGKKQIGEKPKFSRAVPVFYSDLARQIERASMNAAPAKAWLDYLKGLQNKGVKADEIQWSGITDWLQMQDGKVTKEAVVEYLRENGVKVEETVLGGGAKTTERDELTVKLTSLGYDPMFDDISESFIGVERRSDHKPYMVKDYPVSTWATAQRLSDLPADVREVAERIESVSNSMIVHEETGTTRYAKYTLPGGEKYRELLLTLPEKKPKPWTVRDAGPGRNMRFEVLDADGVVRAQAPTEAVARSRAEILAPRNDKETFRSDHFYQPNILSHVRFNERTDAEGKRVLFIEEIQSDWAQKGKREGFAFKARSDEDTLRLLDEAGYKAENNGTNWVVTSKDGSPVPNKLAGGSAKNQFASNLQQVAGIVLGRKDLYPGFGMPPAAPFVGKTEAWVSLALKRMIRYASENGFERVAWTTGAQQVERYDLSKQIDSILYGKMPEGDGFFVAAYKDGRPAIKESGVDIQRVEQLFGKDIADRVANDIGERDIDGYPKNYRRLAGLDLKVGGSGMHQFYDKLVPNIANDALKKLGGGRVGDVALPEMQKKWFFKTTSGQRIPFATEQEAASFKGNGRGEIQYQAVDGKQPSFDITPAMREKSLAGMPLFQRGLGSPGAGLSTAEVTRIISDPVAKLKNIPAVQVVQTAKEIPGVTEAMLAEEGGNIEGAYVDGKIYLVAENLHSAERVREVLAHEAIGHLSVETMLEQARPGLFDKLTKQVNMLERGGNRYIRELAAVVDERQPNLDENTRASEIIALIAERGDQIPQGNNAVRSLYQRIIDGIKAFYKLVFGKDLTDQDVRDIVATAERWAQGEEHVTAAVEGTLTTKPLLSVGGATPGRFRPKGIIEFPKPYTGPSGAKIVAYEWKWRHEDIVDNRGEDRTIRVSDWEEATTNPETKRDIVHQYHVVLASGEERVVSAETAATLLGLPVDRIRRKIKHEMDAERERLRQAKETVERFEKMATDTVEQQREFWQKKSDESLAQHGQWRTIAQPSERTLLTKGGRYVAVYTADKGAIRAMEDAGWHRTDWLGGEPGQIPLFSRAATFPSARAVFSDLTHSPKVSGFVNAITNSPSSLGLFNGVNTQYHKAVTLAKKGKPQFKAVFDRLQDYLNDTNAIAVTAEQKAPAIFRELTGMRPSAIKAYFKGAAKESDIQAIGPWLNYGTLYGGGSPLEGVVWTDDELRGKQAKRLLPRVKPLTDVQIPLYHQARAAVAQSLEDGAKSIIYRHVKRHGVEFDKTESLDEVVASVKEQLQETRDELGIKSDLATENADEAFAKSEDAKTKYEADKRDRVARVAADNAQAEYERAQKDLDAIAADISTMDALLGTKDAPGTIDRIEKQANDLIEHGYMPLKRFGNRTVTAYDKDGKVKFFSAYDGTPLVPSSANLEMMKSAQAIRELHPDWTVKTGVKSEKSWQMYQGLSIEALENFLDFLDPETKAELERDATIQEYLKNSINNRSVMKELIHRKGTPGFSNDIPRILASFITSHARNASGLYHIGEAKRLVEEIPKEEGDVKDEATDLVKYVTEPGEEATKLRGFLFFHFLGGSVAAAAVNLTQTVMMTAPYLAQFASVKKVTGSVLAAAKMAVMDPKAIAGEKGEALQKAEGDGITAPQQIHHLTATASNNPFSSNRHFRTFMTIWGGMFGAAEVFNRRVAFLSAYDIAKANGMDKDAAYEFASSAVVETQGLYNKGNRPNWARGALGATVFTFKTFSVMYLELLKRLPPKQQLMMLGILMLAAGAEGLPFEEDIADLVDTLGQWLGFSTNTGKWTGKLIRDTLGQEFERPLLKGLGGMLPLDLHSRLGMANLIPGTSFFKPSEIDKTRDVAEAVGPLGGVLKNLSDSLQMLARGHWDSAAVNAAPKSVRDAYNGAHMAITGESQDTKGRLAMKDVTAAESFGKMIGFNPRRAAAEGEAKREIMLDKNLRTVRMDDIASDWADGILRKDPEKTQDARDRLREWNIDNPEMRIDGQQMLRSVQERVRAGRMTGEQRFLKSVPKPMRAEAKEALR